MNRRLTLAALCALATATLFAVGPAFAADAGPFRIGFILPMTGQSASTGKQIEAAAKLWMAQNGASVAGRKIELVIKDDAGVADSTRRIAQEMVVNEKIDVLAGFGLTPLAFAAAPIATQSKTPMVVTAAATSAITEQSPYIVRTSFTLPQVTVPIADWAAKHGIKKAVTFVADYGPGIDAERFFKSQFKLNGGDITGEIRTPLKSPDFSPFLQKVADLKPDAVFVFLPSGQGAAFMKQFGERGLDKSGIKLIGTGDVVDDDQLNDIGDVALGVVNSHHYSAAHPSATNKKFVAAFEAANKFRPNFMAVAGYDGMHLIYNALAATKGAGGGDALLAAMKGQIFESPRGQILIDAQTRDIVQDVYIRKVERVAAMGNQLYNVEFDVQKAVKDPAKLK
ncbi:MAG: ABC transporter substrate-binding protein [Pseudomonadota bacterium]|nr:ABC transporter substrate-binding protein [Pseudomonadota bacterium]